MIGLPFGNIDPGARDRWHGVRRLLPAAAISVVLSACATTRAAAVIEGPPLSVPQPPERVVVPFEEEPLVATGIAPETPILSPRVTQTPPPRRTPPARGDNDTRTEAPAAAATGPVGPTIAATETPRELKPVPSPAEPAVDATVIQTQLKQVDALLKAVDPSKYNTGTYKDAKQFAAQANQKLKEGNLRYASDAADKAYKLALSLAGR